MVTNKRKKVVKYRAHTTHGGGHRKKRRGAGNRGGRGRAGSGKKSKVKKQNYPKLGKKGFSSINQSKNKTLDFNKLNQLIQKKKIVAKEGVIDLTTLGYQKLLATGTPPSKITLKISQFSKKAEEKINVAGGSLIKESKTKETTPAKENKDKKETKESKKEEAKEKEVSPEE